MCLKLTSNDDNILAIPQNKRNKRLFTDIGSVDPGLGPE